MEINDHSAPVVAGCRLILQLHVWVHLGAPFLSRWPKIGGEHLHEEDGDDNQDKDEVPGHQHGLMEVSVKTVSGAEAVPGAVAEEVGIQFAEGQLSEEEHYKADAEEAKPHGAALVGGGGIHCCPQKGDQACY